MQIRLSSFTKSAHFKLEIDKINFNLLLIIFPTTRLPRMIDPSTVFGAILVGGQIRQNLQ